MSREEQGLNMQVKLWDVGEITSVNKDQRNDQGITRLFSLSPLESNKQSNLAPVIA